MLAVARVAGETAPLLFTSSIVGTQTSWNPLHALQSVPVAIFELSESPDPRHARAWAAALVLLLFILLTSLAARWLATRSRRRAPASLEEENDVDTIEPSMRVETKRQPLPPRERLERIFGIEDLDAIYGWKPAVKGVTMDVYKNLVTAIIGPSGCGKSTYIRCSTG